MHSSCHILDTGSIWLKEFAFALSNLVTTQNWCPAYRPLGHWETWEKIEQVSDPAISMIRFPLQRGYARFPVSRLLPFSHSLTARLRRRSVKPDETVLICTAPFYAPVAEQWPGPVVYYLTDLTKKYEGMNERQIIALDRRMCRAARVVCPNSPRLAEYLGGEANCDADKITVIPNATRAQNVLDRPLLAATNLPEDVRDLPRPVIGVIGNLGANLDWLLIARAVAETKDASWVFVGPTDTNIADQAQQQARRDLLRRGSRVRFVGRKHYGDLCRYARAFDAALLPYLKKEPTYSGSATRFYEHLAACRPMLASRGFHELLSKEPLLRLIDTGEEIAAAIEDLKRTGFRDGFEELRWRASKEGTWGVRARDLMAAANCAVGLQVA